MDSINYSKARAKLSALLDRAENGKPVEITRRGRNSAIIISKEYFDSITQKECNNMHKSSKV